jgi:hypothetical protein
MASFLRSTPLSLYSIPVVWFSAYYPVVLRVSTSTHKYPIVDIVSFQTTLLLNLGGLNKLVSSFMMDDTRVRSYH